MYDVFVEEIVVRKTDTKAVLMRLGIIAVAIALCVLTLMYLFVVFPLCFMVIVVACYFFFKFQSVEYEYAFTNGELDVDKIMGRRRRKKMIETNHLKIVLMAPYTAEYEQEATSYNVTTKYDCAAMSGSVDNWFVIFEERNGTYGFLIFKPSQRLVEAMKPYLKKKLKGT